jgi:hypothetical protein
MKMSRNKYQRDSRGELMLVHQCTECNSLSINRIAADDEAGTVVAVFEESLRLTQPIHALCQNHGIVMLKTDDMRIVYTQLYGRSVETAMPVWA